MHCYEDGGLCKLGHACIAVRMRVFVCADIHSGMCVFIENDTFDPLDQYRDDDVSRYFEIRYFFKGL